MNARLSSTALGVQVDYKTKLVTFEQNERAVTAQLETGHKRETIRVVYLAGCDGGCANSYSWALQAALTSNSFTWLTLKSLRALSRGRFTFIWAPAVWLSSCPHPDSGPTTAHRPGTRRLLKSQPHCAFESLRADVEPLLGQSVSTGVIGFPLAACITGWLIIFRLNASFLQAMQVTCIA